ncbi:hypothetical protein FA95DRAFT_1577241 [Auriscalpium vulgare]|uniref:Uncharacterized protein n=1 Tax=Auriscalpium vulgare TaxID=40419 RepID=A0ACB8R7D7_9AGAM|nr:hypothetical protein FA95DRAFT_1577241 [Auriscalpium vulgare]
MSQSSGPPVPHAFLSNPRSRRPYHFYVVARGTQAGMFDDWLMASPLVTGFPGAQFRGYHDYDDAVAAYHAAMEALPAPVDEHPNSLVFHFEDPDAGSLPSDIDDQPSEPLTIQPPPYGAAPPIAPAAQPAPSTSSTQPTPPTQPVQPAQETSSVQSVQPAPLTSTAPSALSHSAAVAPGSSLRNASGNEADASTTSAGSLRIPRPQPGTYNEQDLDELEEQMRQLNVDDMLDFLSGRRVPGSSAASSEEPIVMTVSLARNPNPAHGEGAFRILVRTNLSVGSPQSMDVGMLNESAQDAAAVLPPIAVEDADHDHDDGGYSTAPHSPIEFASGGLPSDVSSLSVVSTPSASPSLSSVTTSSAQRAAAGPADPCETAALNAAVIPPRRGSLARHGAVPTSTRPRAPTGARAFPPSGGRTPHASTSSSVRATASGSSSACPSAASDDGWFAVVRGHVQGVFRGPLTNIIPFIVDFPGPFFAEFSTRDAAVQWFIESQA